MSSDLKKFLNQKVRQYNCASFIDDDPIQIPHLFADEKNIEIAGFIAALLAWGQRKTIINKSRLLIKMMDDNPYQFLMNADKNDFKQFKSFVHRTFNGDDCVFTIQSLQNIYKNHHGLKSVFEKGYLQHGDIKGAIMHFREIFFEKKHLSRTEKHIPDLDRGSAGKRMNLFLKWMVRKDNTEVDFGIWKNIPASALYIPLDLHTGNAARALGLITRKQNDWLAVEELTNHLRQFDANDPVKYDYALFCLSMYEKDFKTGNVNF